MDSTDDPYLPPDRLAVLEAKLVSREAMTRSEMHRLLKHVAARWKRFIRGCCRRHALLPHEVDDATALALAGILWNLQRRHESTLHAVARSGVDGVDIKRHIGRIAYFKAIDVINARPEDPALPDGPEAGQDDRGDARIATLAPQDQPDLLEETLGEAMTAGVIGAAEADLLRDRRAGMELYEIALTHGLADKTTKLDTARGYASKAIKAVVDTLTAFCKRGQA